VVAKFHYSRQNVVGQPLRAPKIQAEIGPSTAGARATAQIGSAIGAVGQSVAGVLGDLAGYQERVEEEQRAAKANRFRRRLTGAHHSLMNDPNNGYRYKQGQNAVEGREKVTEAYDESYRKLIQDKEFANDPAVLERIEEIYADDRMRFVEMRDKHAAAQSQVVYEESHEAAMESFAIQAYDSIMAGESVHTLDNLYLADQTMREHAERQGWPPGKADVELLKYKTGIHTKIINGFIDQGSVHEARAYLEGYKDQPTELYMGAMGPTITRLNRVGDQLDAVGTAADIMAQAQNDPTAAVELLYGKLGRGEISGRQYTAARDQTFRRITDNEKVRHLRNNEGLSAFMLEADTARIEGRDLPTMGNRHLNNVDDEGKKDAAHYLAGLIERKRLSRKSRTASQRVEDRRLAKARFASISEAVKVKMSDAEYLNKYKGLLLTDEVAYYENLAELHQVQADWEFYGSERGAAMTRRANALAEEFHLKGRQAKDFKALWVRDAMSFRSDDVKDPKSGRSNESADAMALLYKTKVRVPGVIYGENELSFWKAIDRDDYRGGTIETLDGEVKTIDPAFGKWVREGNNAQTLDFSTFVEVSDEPPPAAAPPPSLEPDPTTVPRGGQVGEAQDIGKLRTGGGAPFKVGMKPNHIVFRRPDGKGVSIDVTQTTNEQLADFFRRYGAPVQRGRFRKKK
jgi:hypothetical protein